MKNTVICIWFIGALILLSGCGDNKVPDSKSAPSPTVSAKQAGTDKQQVSVGQSSSNESAATPTSLNTLGKGVEVHLEASTPQDVKLQ